MDDPIHILPSQKRASLESAEDTAVNRFSTVERPTARKRTGPLTTDILKRSFDFLLALLGLVLLSPFLLVIAVATKLDSKGSILYRGVRTGRHGKPFRILKFRSMVVDGEQRGGTCTGSNDGRVTSVGRFLRKYKLDELPNLMNVLMGQMSLVGPRPEVFEYTDLYTDEERLILSVRPGITDLASLEFSNQQELVGDDDPDATFRAVVLPRKNALRVKYVKEQSFLGDLRILFQTVWLVLTMPFRGRLRAQQSPQRARSPARNEG